MIQMSDDIIQYDGTCTWIIHQSTGFNGSAMKIQSLWFFPFGKSHAEGLHPSLCTGPNRFHALWPTWTTVEPIRLCLIPGYSVSVEKLELLASMMSHLLLAVVVLSLMVKRFYTEQIRIIDYSHRLGVAFLMLMVIIGDQNYGCVISQHGGDLFLGSHCKLCANVANVLIRSCYTPGVVFMQQSSRNITHFGATVILVFSPRHGNGPVHISWRYKHAWKFWISESWFYSVNFWRSFTCCWSPWHTFCQYIHSTSANWQAFPHTWFHFPFVKLSSVMFHMAQSRKRVYILLWSVATFAMQPLLVSWEMLWPGSFPMAFMTP